MIFSACMPSSALDKGWYHARTPVKQDWSVDKRPGSLALHGGPFAFKDDECLAMLLRKQDAIRGVWQTTVDFEPTMAGEEAGTTLWWSKYAYGSLGIRGVGELGRSAKGKELVFRASNPDEEKEDVSGLSVALPLGLRTLQETVTPLSLCGPILIKIEALDYGYEFFVSHNIDSPTFKKVGHLAARALTRMRGDNSFCTGSMLGVYAFGVNSRACLNDAYFSEMSWKGIRAGGV